MAIRPVYLDHLATTPVDPRVLEAMWPYFTTYYGNAGSLAHAYGWKAADALEAARDRIATLLGVTDREIVLTSGATESNNLAIKGVLPGLSRKGRHIVTGATEHKAVLDPVRRLAREGWDVTVVPSDPYGQTTCEAVEAALKPETVLVSVMAANNEVGTLNPIEVIGRLCRERRIVFHTDATQAVGKIPLDVRAAAVDLLSLSGHKLYGPKGIGALFVRRLGGPPIRLTPQVDGGGQEFGLRSGTVPVPLAVGLGVAADLARQERESEAGRLHALRERLHRGLVERLKGLILNGHPVDRLPGCLNLSFAGVEGEALMMGMREVAVSSGAACTSAHPEPSHVLRAMGRDEALARASLRFGLGRFTTEDEIDRAVDAVVRAVERLRDVAPA